MLITREPYRAYARALALFYPDAGDPEDRRAAGPGVAYSTQRQARSRRQSSSPAR